MVVFTCGHCGESVNKPKVEKHYLTKCRSRNPNLSCMDCFKDFFGTDYEAHNKCVTEEQRYSAKGFVAKEKKGEQKQNAWVEMVQSVLDEQTSAPANVLRILNAVSKHTNTPRKKPKFVNFVKNVCGHKTNQADIDAAWDMISVKLAELAGQNQRNRKQDQSKGEPNPEKNESIVEDENEVSSSEIQPANGEAENSEDVGKHVKKSKKQLKEEKKRLKYETELHSAGQVVDEEMEESEQKIKKEKKKKGETNGDVSGEVQEGTGKNKNKKRKRLDTANEIAAAIAEAQDNGVDDPPQLENLRISEEKTKKKKPKVVEPENVDESICLHDQNVARNEEEYSRPEMFNWHAVIVSLLSKKGNELPFKRLQKKVLGEYSEVTGQEVDDRIADKFIKKLRSAPNVKVDKNRVLLMD